MTAKRMWFPRWDKCWACNSELTERTYDTEVEGNPLLRWHCKACKFDFVSRTWEQGPYEDECICWYGKEGQDQCPIHKDQPKHPKNKKKKQEPDDDDIPI